MKLRNPVTVGLLDFFTVGIYGLFWWYYANRELADLGRARGTQELGDNPALSVLALIPGGFVLVPAIMTMLNTAKRVQTAQRLAGHPEPQLMSQAVGFILVLVFAPVGLWYLQSELNKVWASETEGGAAELPGAGSATAAQPAQPVEEPSRQEAPPPSQ